MEALESFINAVGGIVWGPALIVLLVGAGLYLTARQKFVQIRAFGHGVALITGKYDKAEDEGHITHFQALSTALSATIGVGNIAGVATAIHYGGRGALVWMWITALVGMAIKFTSCTLSVKYRNKMKDGSVRGGPMYYIENGLGEEWKPMAWFFAFAAAISAFGIGNMVQSNSVADALLDLYKSFAAPSGKMEIGFRVGTGIIMAGLTGVVIIGGIKRIAKVAARLVPLMSIVYIGGALAILLANYDLIIPSLAGIFADAFKDAAPQGGFAGAAVALTIQWGVKRGIFSNESGLGSAPMAHAAAKTNIPSREGLVAMLGPFIDTILVCTMTGLVIVISGQWTVLGSDGELLNGAPLTQQAFAWGLPKGGNWIVGICLALFSYSTILGWYYYGETATTYLGGKRLVNIYKWIYVILIPLGAYLKLKLVWNIADIFNGLMAIPNLIALLILSDIAAKEKEDYLSEHYGSKGDTD